MIIITNKLNSILKMVKFITISPVSEKDFIIVTGADSSHYKSLNQLLSSICLYEPNTKTIVFDLGLTLSEQEQLKEKFKTIQIRLFDYSKYPEYFNINVNAGEYAWKPIIISDMLNEFKCSVCWLDAGNIALSPFITIKKIMNSVGFYSPYSDGTIFKWTHPKTINFLKASDNLLSKRNLNGACVAVNYKYNKVRKVVDKWKQCAITKGCIAPEGSNRNNHRQDQAVLSILAYQYNIINTMFNKYYGFTIHKDID